MIIREIEKKDNKAIEVIIKESLESVQLNIQGTAYFDPQLGTLFEHYQSLKNSMYWVAELDHEVVGGIGIGLFDETKGICELQKLYLKDKVKGKGYADLLMETALAYASQHYNACYLETRHELKAAGGLYQKYGFKLLSEPIMGSEHSAMDAWYLKELN
ncbi:GNAT family N-acetyltransferase [Bacillus mesophilum]|uniref:GNAT family N-acetyltransferase n=1 Tax=Bacillus mesophilum TaxID=1071718 RepID=A0A7V7UVI8_9BACI|nr:GNAT family N-acetyltransferase [Bacillus mesophilum]KAB2332826.1 GNAT family N-acetyltransferase [Bacillus mesophilum]